VVDWARRNADLTGLAGLHWVVEDARKFVQREIKRHDGTLIPLTVKTGIRTSHSPAKEVAALKIEEVLAIVHIDHGVSLGRGCCIIHRQIEPYPAVPVQGGHPEGIGQQRDLSVGGSTSTSTSTSGAAVQIFPTEDFEPYRIPIPVRKGSVRAEGPRGIPFHRNPSPAGEFERYCAGACRQRDPPG